MNLFLLGLLVASLVVSSNAAALPSDNACPAPGGSIYGANCVCDT